MYLTDGCWFLISCVIQHYAPVVGWGGEEQVHNVDYDPVKTVGGGWTEREEKEQERERERGDVYTTRVQMALTLAVWCELAVKSPPPQTCSNQLKSPSQHNTTVWTLDSPHLPLHKITYWPMILMGPVLNRFHRGEWITWGSGGEGALDTPGPLNGIERSNAFAPMKSIMHRAIKIIGQ